MRALKVRVIKSGDKFFPQYRWQDEDKTHSKKIDWLTTNDLFSSIFGTTDWFFVYPGDDKEKKKPVSFDEQEKAITYAKKLKDDNDPTVVWEG